MLWVYGHRNIFYSYSAGIDISLDFSFSEFHKKYN